VKLKKTLRAFLATVSLLILGLPGALKANAESDNADLNLVFEVDESRSLSLRDVEAERQALSQIVTSPVLFDRNVRVTLLPFSSGVSSPRRLQGCETVEITAKNAETLLKCIKQIKRQKEPFAASNTNFASAIRVANSILKSQEGANAIVLLTDGQYDPDGNGNVSSQEQSELDDALRESRDINATIWSLGFGKAQLTTLEQYSEAGAQPALKCPSLPSAILAKTADLSMQLSNLISAVSCTSPPPPPAQTPSKYPVHPMVETLGVTVYSTSSEAPSLTDPSGNVACFNWNKFSYGTEVKVTQYSCKVSVNSDQSGDWTVVTDGDATAMWQSSGTLESKLVNCLSNPALQVTRSSGNPIDWKYKSKWPVMRGAFLNSTGGTLREFSIEANVESIPIEIPSDLKNSATRIEVVLDRDTFSEFPFTMTRASCDLSPPQSSTSITPTSSTKVPPPGTTDPGDGDGDDDDDDGGVVPPWIKVLGLTVLIGAGGLAFKRFKSSRVFPAGTVVSQESFDRPGVFVPLDGEIEGKRRVSLVNGGGKFLQLGPYAAEADISLQRLGDEIRVQYPTQQLDDKDQPIVDEQVVPFGISLKVQGFVIRVDAPEGLDVEEDE
jgi:hypothetical protein